MSEELPQVIGQHAQPTTTGVLPAGPSAGASLITISFYGKLTNGKHHEEKTFRGIANSESIVATEGYAKYAHVPRPQRVAMTVIEGYEPMTITVPLLLDKTTGGDVESDIQALEWMGGRGIAFNGGFFSPGTGPSPLVRLQSVDGTGMETFLVPQQYQTERLRWVVTGLDWDKTPSSGVLRERDEARRIRQGVVVTLTQYVDPKFDEGTNSPAAKAKEKEALGNQYTTVEVPGRTGRETSISAIAAFFCKDTKVAGELIKANSGNPRIGSNPVKTLKNGTKVKVPLTAINPT